MKKFLFCLLLAGTPAVLHAQTPTLGVTAGYGRTHLTSSDAVYKAVGHGMYHAGISADVWVAPAFSVHPELLYAAQFYDSDVADFNRDITYLSVPVLAHYHTGWVFLEIGPQLNVPLSVKNEDGDDVKAETNAVSLDYVVEAGIERRVGPSIGLRYDGGATHIFKTSAGGVIGNADLKTSTFSLVAAWTFALSR